MRGGKKGNVLATTRARCHFISGTAGPDKIGVGKKVEEQEGIIGTGTGNAGQGRKGLSGQRLDAVLS